VENGQKQTQLKNEKEKKKMERESRLAILRKEIRMIEHRQEN